MPNISQANVAIKVSVIFEEINLSSPDRQSLPRNGIEDKLKRVGNKFWSLSERFFLPYILLSARLSLLDHGWKSVERLMAWWRQSLFNGFIAFTPFISPTSTLPLALLLFRRALLWVAWSIIFQQALAASDNSRFSYTGGWFLFVIIKLYRGPWIEGKCLRRSHTVLCLRELGQSNPSEVCRGKTMKLAQKTNFFFLLLQPSPNMMIQVFCWLGRSDKTRQLVYQCHEVPTVVQLGSILKNKKSSDTHPFE